MSPFTLVSFARLGGCWLPGAHPFFLYPWQPCVTHYSISVPRLSMLRRFIQESRFILFQILPRNLKGAGSSIQHDPYSGPDDPSLTPAPQHLSSPPLPAMELTAALSPLSRECPQACFPDSLFSPLSKACCVLILCTSQHPNKKKKRHIQTGLVRKNLIKGCFTKVQSGFKEKSRDDTVVQDEVNIPGSLGGGGGRFYS